MTPGADDVKSNQNVGGSIMLENIGSPNNALDFGTALSH